MAKYNNLLRLIPSHPNAEIIAVQYHTTSIPCSWIQIQTRILRRSISIKLDAIVDSLLPAQKVPNQVLFESAMDSQRHKSADYNANDEACYPEFKTPLDIEKHAASVYILTIFYDVQAEICAACFSCRVLQVEELDEQHNQYLVKDNRGMSFTVKYSHIQGTAICSCKHYMRIGLLCRHIFLVFKDENIRKILYFYITPRWCKTNLLKPMINIPDMDFDIVTAVEGKKTALSRLWSDIHYCVAAAEQKPDLLDGFSKVIRQQKNILQNAIQSNLIPP
ncbi:hypothetical protein DM860_017484 [Cuscuta australis]|uniref:Protein FAR1-RELATED SEQUENCE n=1 Tax=Cuscuta australis TaxID=267555 RepID=A0A328E0N6_9ASTE|nr:hypothetical protein DM860_017484 [Cuscuta australis]